MLDSAAASAARASPSAAATAQATLLDDPLASSEEACIIGDPSCVPCHVCEGRGVVSYEMKYDHEMPCPCCLGKGRVRQGGASTNLLSSLLMSLDME